jgi:hypothetical protein
MWEMFLFKSKNFEFSHSLGRDRTITDHAPAGAEQGRTEDEALIDVFPRRDLAGTWNDALNNSLGRFKTRRNVISVITTAPARAVPPGVGITRPPRMPARRPLKNSKRVALIPMRKLPIVAETGMKFSTRRN